MVARAFSRTGDGPAGVLYTPSLGGEPMTDELQAASTDAPSQPVVNIRGDRVALGPLHRGLLPLIERWDNDFQTADLGGDDPRPHSAESIAAGWEPLLRGERPDWIGFAIYALPELRPIGITNIRDFSNPHGTAEFGITIGDVSDRGRGSVPKRPDCSSTTRSPCSASTTSGSTPRRTTWRAPCLRESRVPRDRAAEGSTDAGWNALRRSADGLYCRRVRPAGNMGLTGDWP